MIKNSQQTWKIIENISIDKEHLPKPLQVTSLLNEKNWMFSFKTGNKARKSFLTILIQDCIGLRWYNKTRKGNKKHTDWEGRNKLSHSVITINK